MKQKISRFFCFQERATSFKVETIAGITTFMTMAYILVVQPSLMVGDADYVLPLAGLISLKDATELAKDSQVMKDANRELGLTGLENPLLRIVTLALPVIPKVKMSDLGMVDVLRKELIPLFV